MLFLVLAAQFVLARSLMLGGPGTLTGLVSDLAFAGLVALLISLTPRRLASVLAVVTCSIVSFALVSSVLYVSYYDALPTLDMLAFLGQAGDVKDNIFDLWVLADWLFLASPLIVLAASFPVRPRRFSVGVVHAVSVIAMAGMLAWATSSLLAIDGPVDSLIASRARGVVAFQAATVLEEPAVAQPVVTERSAEETKSPLVQEIDGILGREDAQRIVKFGPGILKGKNVLVVQFEALQTHALGYSAEGTEITPNLNDLVERSILFPNGVGLIAKGNTSDAEWAANSGLYPSIKKATSLQWGDKEVPALPRLLSKQGYFTFTMHTNDASFWNRRQLYGALGFDKFYDKAFFGEGPMLGGSRGDYALYERALPEIVRLHAAEQPFYGQIVTIASHAPFKFHKEMRTRLELPKGYADAGIGGYLQSVRDADRAFGQFLEKLEEAGVLEDTVLIIYGDHYGPKIERDTKKLPESVDFFGRQYTSMDRLTVPVIIHLPGQVRSMVNTEPVGEVDIMPTVADLVGLDLTDVPNFGRSAFMKGRTLIVPRRYVTSGSYVISEGLVEMAGLGFEGAQSRPARGSTAPVPIRERDYEDARRILELSDAYANSLPVRADYTDDPNAFIPTKAGRGEE